MKKITLPVICFSAILFIVFATALTISQPKLRIALSGTDFRGQYTGGLMVYKNVRENLYDIDTQVQWQHSFLPELTKPQLMVYSYHPLIAYILRPLGALSFGNAYRVMLIINIVFLFITISLTKKILTVRKAHEDMSAIYAAYAFYLPVWFALLQNQFSFLLYILLFFVWKAMRGHKDIAAGIWLSALIFKPHLLVVPVLVFMFTRRWRLLSGFLSGTITTSLITWILLGTQGIKKFFSFLILLSRAGDSFTIHTAAEPTLKGIFHATLHTDHLPVWATTLWGILCLVLIARLIYAKMFIKENDPLFDIWFGTLIIVMLVTSIHTNYHDLFLLILPLSFTIRYLLQREKKSLLSFPHTKKLAWYSICFGVFILTVLWVFFPPLAVVSTVLLFLYIDHLYAFKISSIFPKK